MKIRFSIVMALAVSVITAWSSTAQAEYLFGPDEPFELMTPDDNALGIDVGGWLQGGYHNKQTPLSTTYNDGLSFNDVPGNFNLQQGYLYAERVAESDETGIDFGFRLDGLYGTDAQKTQAFGGPGWDNGWDNGPYGWAIPQAYVTAQSGDLGIMVGHFYTLVGYEVVTAPGNFFYSHSYTMFNSEPFTHTGALATYSVNDDITVYGGWTAGWDTGFEQFMGGSNFLGGISASLTEDITATYITTIGNFGARGTDAYSHSLVFNVGLAENWEYVLQSDFVDIGDDRGAGNAHQIGVNQYLFYTINDTFKAGVRAEWWKNDGNSHYETTGGINITPMANLIIRPEVRYDWDPNVPGTSFSQTTFGVDAILTY